MGILLRNRSLKGRFSPPSTNPFDTAYNDVRVFKTIGIQQNDSWAGTASQMDTEYNKYMKDAYRNPPDNDVYFGVRSVLRWNEQLKDDPKNGGPGTTIPTLAEMRDPTWPGYTWNDANGNPTGTHKLDTMRNAQCVIDGKAKVLIQISVSATSGTPVPAFMMLPNRTLFLSAAQANDGRDHFHSDWAWEGNDVGGDGTNDVRVKFWNATARNYAYNFSLACVERFVGTAAGGNNIGSIKIGEYFAGNIQPPDYPGSTANENAYWNYLQGFSDGMNGMTPAADGKRVWIHQSNPQNTDVRSYDDLINFKFGISASDPQFFDSTAEHFSRDARHGSIPMAAPGDSPNYVNASRRDHVWEVPPANPFGFTNGQTVDVEPQHGAWFYGHLGVLRMDTEFVIGVGAANTTYAGQTQNAFKEAMDRFGPGGSLRDTWGGVPFLG